MTTLSDIIKKGEDLCQKEVSRLAVNELIPFEQIEPFKRLAVIFDEKIKSHNHTQAIAIIEGARDMVIEAIDENIKINQMTHRIGSHSDDYGGESDYPCDCDEKEKKIAVKALESLKIKVNSALTQVVEKLKLTLTLEEI